MIIMILIGQTNKGITLIPIKSQSSEDDLENIESKNFLP